MTDMLPFDLPMLARWCRGEIADRRQPTAAKLFDYFDQLDFDAMTDLVVQPDVIVDSAASSEQKARLESAGWKLDAHPLYVPRTLVYNAFEEFARGRSERGGVFVVKAAAGLGKTALLTHWLPGRHDAAGFYFRYRDHRVETAKMRQALWEQLGSQFKLGPKPVPDEHDFVGRLEARLEEIAQHHLGQDKRLLLFIDALDEANDKDLAAKLIPKVLPPRVFVIASSRPSDLETDHLSVLEAAGARIFPLAPQDNLPDIETYFDQALRQWLAPGQAKQLAEATGGSFMLAALLREAIAQGNLTVAEATDSGQQWLHVPEGKRLTAYYEECWSRAGKLAPLEARKRFKKGLMEFAGLMLAAFNWIGDRQALSILQWLENSANPRDRFWSPDNFKTVLAALNWLLERRRWEKDGYQAEFRQFRHQSAREFVIDLSLRHQSMRDYLAHEDGPLWYQDADMHASVGQFYVERAKQSGWASVDPYGRSYAVRHLLRSASAETRRLGAATLASLDYMDTAIGDENQERTESAEAAP